MKIYDTLILGSGYFSAGYALGHGSCAIIEEHQICDTGFYLPLPGFALPHYEPRTEIGRHFAGILSEMGLIRDGMLNGNALECAFCRFLLEQEIIPTLKCRAVGITETDDGLLDVTLSTNEGLTHLYAKHILDTVPRADAWRITVLFLADDIDMLAPKLSEVFPGATLEPAFYPGRYALHLPVEAMDENAVKPWIHRKWQELGTDARILYIAPVFYPDGPTGIPGDADYRHPIEALEAGYFYARGNRA